MLMTIVPNHRQLRILNLLARPVSVCFLIFIWHRNYNLLSRFYDYSILTSAVGYLHSGLTPYRDFTTPLQSLTIYLCDAAELVFGRRYLALAYANLTLGLLGYFILLRMLRQVFSFFPRVIIATAFCVATFFQHGILWYNSVAMFLLAITCLQAAKLVHQPEIRGPDILKLCVLLFLSSINKLNFHALGMGLVFLAFTAHCLVHHTRIKSIILCGIFFVVAGVILGPAFEVLLNRTTLDNFIENVVRTPTSRSAEFFTFFNPKLTGGGGRSFSLFNPNLYLKIIHDYYPDRWIRGVYLVGFLIYLCCLRIAVLPPRKSDRANPPASPFVKLCCLVALPLFFFASLLLSVTNVEIEVLTSFFLVIGLASMLVLLTKYFSPQQQHYFQTTVTVLGVYFLLVGSASAFMHSRIRYLERSWAKIALEAVEKQHSLSAMKDAVPFFDAETISPEFEPYFAGVRFTEIAQKQLTRVVSFMKQFPEGQNARDIYWGPGLEILGRVYGVQRRGHLPLWYHDGVTYRDRDVSTVIRELAKAHYEWIVAADLKSNMNPEIIEYIQKSYECVENDEILVYHRIH